MGLNQHKPGLRPFYNKSHSAARVEIIVAPGDALHVSDDVAAQLERTSIKEGEPPAPVEGDEAAKSKAPRAKK